MRHVALLTLCLFWCTAMGCVAGGVTTASPETLRTKATEDLVYGYGYDQKIWGKKNANLRAELEHRATFSPESWQLIDAGEIKQGCASSVVLASWGPPTKCETTVLGLTKSEVWRYGDYGTRPITLVYIANSHVTGWSELK